MSGDEVQDFQPILDRLKTAVAALKVGNSTDAGVNIGPMVSQKQWDRVQDYIRLGIGEGAELLVGGEGRPRGLDRMQMHSAR